MIRKLGFFVGIFLCGFFFSQKKEELQKQNIELKKQIFVNLNSKSIFDSTVLSRYLVEENKNHLVASQV